MADVEYTYPCIDDATIGQNGVSNYSTGSGVSGWIWVRHHNVNTHRMAAAWRFQVPDSVTIADITEATISVDAANSSGTFKGTLSVIEDVDDALGSSSPNRPTDHWDTDNGSITWDETGSITAGDTLTSGDFATVLKAALTAGTAVGGYYNVAVMHYGATTNGGVQVKSVENTGTLKPELDVTVTEPAVDGGLTTVAPSASASLAPATNLQRQDVDYDYDSSRTADRRYLDIYEPVGAAPAGGRPLMMFIHGGGWVAGTEGGDDTEHMELALARGYTFVSLRYTLSELNGTVTTYNTNTHPMPTQDVGAALTFLDNNFNVDMDEFVLTAYSAGAQIALEYAATYFDEETYTWAYTGPSGDARGDNEPLTGSTFDFTQGRTGLPKPKGVFVWDAPLDLTAVRAHNSVMHNAMRSYLGGTSAEAFYIANNEREADLSYLITGAAGADSIDSMYEGDLSHRGAFKDIPVGFIEARFGTGCAEGADNQQGTTVGEDGGIDALKSAFSDVGLPVSAVGTANGLSAEGGLSHWINKIDNLGAISYPHDKVYIWDDYSELTTWLDWLDTYETTPATSVTAVATASSVTVSTDSGTDASITTTAPAVTVAVGSAGAVGTISNGVTTTAPLVTVAVGSAGAVGTISNGITTTAPAITVAVGSAGAVGTSNASITTTAPLVTVAVGSPTVDTTSSNGITTTAPAVTIATGTAVASKSESRIVTITAPLVTADAGSAGGSGTASQNITTTAPSASALSGTPGVSVSALVTITAPTVVGDAGSAVGSSASPGAVTTAGPLVTASTGTPVVSIQLHAGVTTEAPTVNIAVGRFVKHAGAVTTAPTVVVAAAPNHSVTIAEHESISPAAATVVATVPTPTVGIIQHAGVVVTAVQVVASVPTPDTADEVVCMTEPDYDIIFHQTEHIHPVVGNRGQSEVIKQAVTDLVGPYIPCVTSSSTASSDFGDGISFTVTSSQAETRWYIEENALDIEIDWATGVLSGGSAAAIGDHVLSFYGATVFGITQPFTLTWTVS